MTEPTFKVEEKVYWQVGGQKLKATVKYNSGPGRYGITIDGRSAAGTIWVDEQELRFRKTTMILRDATHAKVVVKSDRTGCTWTVNMTLDPESEIACMMDDEPEPVEQLDAGFSLKLTGRGDAQMDYNLDYLGGSW